MSRTLNRLTARQVATLGLGRHADGGGLYLRVTPNGARSWVFMTTRGGKRTEIGLGAASAVSLAAARQLASKMRELVALGQDPRAILQSADAANSAVPSFSKFAEAYMESKEADWTNAVHSQQWRSSLRDHAQELADIPVDQIDTNLVLSVLQPIWMTKPETAGRLRSRIERILDAARVRGFRSRDSTNPAAWKGHLEHILPSHKNVKRGHHAALPWKEAPSFMIALRQRSALAARCLEFVILTAARSGEALNATWGEIDLETKVWTVPASRMKARKEHEVPLSDDAVSLLQSVLPERPKPTDRVFSVAGASRSNMAMTMLLRRMNFGSITTHGFRSTFRDWAGERTDYPRETIEHALAHGITDKVEKAYRRGTSFDMRRRLMTAWASLLAGALGVDEMVSCIPATKLDQNESSSNPVKKL